jgi:hypothetical protein
MNYDVATCNLNLYRFPREYPPNRSPRQINNRLVVLNDSFKGQPALGRSRIDARVRCEMPRGRSEWLNWP